MISKMSFPGCTTLSSTTVTLLLMLLYWWFFADVLNIIALVVSAESLGNGRDECFSHSVDHVSGDMLNDGSNLKSSIIGMQSSWGLGSVLQLLLVMASMVVGLLSAAVLGALLAVAIFLKSGKIYKLSTAMPSRLQALLTLKKVNINRDFLSI